MNTNPYTVQSTLPQTLYTNTISHALNKLSHTFPNNMGCVFRCLGLITAISLHKYALIFGKSSVEHSTLKFYLFMMFDLILLVCNVFFLNYNMSDYSSNSRRKSDNILFDVYMIEDVIRGNFFLKNVWIFLELKLTKLGLERIRGLGWLNIIKKRLSVGGVNIQKYEINSSEKYTKILYFSGLGSSLTLLLQSLVLFWSLDNKFIDTDTEAAKYVTIFSIFILQWMIPSMLEYCNRGLYRMKVTLCAVENSIN